MDVRRDDPWRRNVQEQRPRLFGKGGRLETNDWVAAKKLRMQLFVFVANLASRKQSNTLFGCEALEEERQFFAPSPRID